MTVNGGNENSNDSNDSGGGNESNESKESAQAELPLPDEIGFGDAISQLEEILRRIEDEEIDLDRLASELKRATGLLEICRGKVRKAEAEVTQIVQSLEPGGGTNRDDA